MLNKSTFLTKDDNSPVFFIAELGINHDGDISLIKKMIDAAVEAKADAIKFQLYEPDLFYNKLLAPEAYALFKSLYIPFEDFLSLKDYAESRGILAFAAPFDEDTLKKLISYQIYPIKIASGDAMTEPWIDELLDQKIPFIISTGSMDDSEIYKLSQKITGSVSAMLYCVSEYPAPEESFDLKYIEKIKEYLPYQVIGFSDHSKGIALSLAAVTLGVKIIERHFTLFPNRSDLDHPLSLSPKEFSDLVSYSRMIEKSLGKGERCPTKIEKNIRKKAGRDAFAKINIPADTIITKDMIVLQRPGSGINSETYKRLIGKKYNKNILKGTKLLDIFPECQL